MTENVNPKCFKCGGDKLRQDDCDRWFCKSCQATLRLLDNGKTVPFLNYETAGAKQRRRRAAR